MAQGKGKTTKRGRGRPVKFAPDMKEVEALARLQCTDSEVGAFFGVSRETVQRHKRNNPEFAEALERGGELGKISLRRAQWRKAIEAGNTAMLIWLGKQLLGQKDRHEIDPGEGAAFGVLVAPATLSPEAWAERARAELAKVNGSDG